MTLHEDLGPNLAATVITTGLIAFISMGLRVYTRVSRRIWGVEDWLMSIGCLPLLTLTIVTAIGSYYGIGAKDSRFTRPGKSGYVETAHFWFFLHEFFYIASIIFVKLSIAFMLNRIAGAKRKFIYVNYGFMTLFVSVNLAAALYVIFRCDPVDAAWRADLIAEGGHCQDPAVMQNLYYFCSSVNIFTDWAISLMPIALLWNVQMNRNTKISVAIILGLGIFTSVSGLIRMKYNVGLTSSHDFLYGLANILIWGYVEPALGMIVGNIATLRPLFRRILKLDSAGATDTHLTGTPRTYGTLSKPDRAHPYQPFDRHDHELGVVTGRTTQIYGGANRERDGLSGSDNESEREILRDAKDTGITVTQQVKINQS